MAKAKNPEIFKRRAQLVQAVKNEKGLCRVGTLDKLLCPEPVRGQLKDFVKSLGAALGAANKKVSVPFSSLVVIVSKDRYTLAKQNERTRSPCPTFLFRRTER